MAYREYIGSRYVPIFGRKDESSIEWDNSKGYEPLTIVTYQGASYTSRQYVPAGIPITDTSYWVLSGNYNAQVEQYRQEVQAYDNRITEVENKFPIESTDIADGAIGTAKLANGAVTADKLADGSVSGGKLANGAVTADKLADNSVRTSNIASGAVTQDKIASGAVTQDKIASGAVTYGKIADGAIDGNKIADGAVTASKIADDAIETQQIANGAVTNNKLAQGSISWDNLDDGLKAWNKSIDLLDEVNIYLNATTGNDETAEVNNMSLPFKTLDAAYAAGDKLGNNFRFHFLDTVTTVEQDSGRNEGYAEYYWNMRVMVGCVLHLFSDKHSGQTLATVPIRININNHSAARGTAGVFFYDTHIGVYSNNIGQMTIRTRHKVDNNWYTDYIECEGSTFWSGGAESSQDYGDSGHLTLDTERLYLIQGSAQLAGIEINGRLEGIFANTRITGLKVNGTDGNHTAVQFTGGTHRINDVSSNPHFVSDPLLFGNQTSSTQPALRWYNAFINFPAESNCRYYAGSGRSKWLMAVALYSCITFMSNPTLAYLNGLGQSDCALSGIRESGSPLVTPSGNHAIDYTS